MKMKKQVKSGLKEGERWSEECEGRREKTGTVGKKENGKQEGL